MWQRTQTKLLTWTKTSTRVESSALRPDNVAQRTLARDQRGVAAQNGLEAVKQAVNASCPDLSSTHHIRIQRYNEKVSFQHGNNLHRGGASGEGLPYAIRPQVVFASTALGIGAGGGNHRESRVAGSIHKGDNAPMDEDAFGGKVTTAKGSRTRDISRAGTVVVVTTERRGQRNT